MATYIFSLLSQVLFNGLHSFRIMVLNISFLMVIQFHWKLAQLTFGQIHLHQQAQGFTDRYDLPSQCPLIIGPSIPEQAEIVHQ